MRIFVLCLAIFFSCVSGMYPATATKETTPVTAKQRAAAYYAQGYLYYLEGSYKLAVPEFMKALKQDPKMGKARYWTAKSEYKMENYKSVINQCNAGLALSPKDKNLISLKKLATEKLATLTPTKAVKTPPAPAKVIVVKTATKETVMEVKANPVEAPKAVIKAVESPKPVAKAPAERRISLDLRNVDISSVLQVFSKETGISVLAGKDVYGKVTVILNNVTPDQALDMILKANGYTYYRQGNVVQVISSGEPARVEELPGGVFVRTFSINYIGPDELKDTLEKLMPSSSSIYTTKGSKSIVVKGSASDIKRAEALIRNIDIPPRQVMVESKIVEVSLTQSQGMGVNASYTNPNNATEVLQTVGLAGSPTDTGAKGLFYTVTDQNISRLVELLSTRTGFHILSSPKVMALNEQKAEIITGSRLGYTVKTVTTTGLVESVEFLDVGTKLDITPSIKSDGLIIMEIHPEISDGQIINNLPQKNSTETTTQLIVRDGQTIIIGGLIRDTAQKQVRGIPILMDIPILGMLFRRTDLSSEKSEIIVLMTPHIITPGAITQMEFEEKSMNTKVEKLTPDQPVDLGR